jgi:hypothetical protein
MEMPRTLFVPAALALVLLSGCKFLDSSPSVPGEEGNADAGQLLPEGGYVGPSGTAAAGARAGDDCSPGTPCRPGLTCLEAVCEATGDSDDGDACVTSDECGPGLACGIPMDCYLERPIVECGFSSCMPSAESEEGDTCVGVTDCGPGLRCERLGFTGFCTPQGSVDVGEPCATDGECLAPLLCTPPGPATSSDEPSCQIPAAVAGQLFVPGVECEDVPQRNDEDAPDVGPEFAVYFEVADGDDGEFYRLPFPNDARLRGGRVDMSGHHNPGPEFIGGGLVQSYLEAAETLDGFSTNPAVYFRFTQVPDFGSVTGDGDNPTLHFANVDPDSPGYGDRVAMRWTITTGGGRFICPRYMAVRPSWSSPLHHGTTYAVYITSGIRGRVGDAIPLVQPDFEAVVDDDAPSDNRLQRAWQAYEPFRGFLADEGIAAETIVGAAVFTTTDPDAALPDIREATRTMELPTLNNVTVCGENVTSPCDDGERGSCVNADGEFIEVHATYEAPVWQHGTRPYVAVADGGDLRFSDGVLEPQGTESICLSMTVPLGEMPEAGWPVSMFGHGTSGTFTSHIAGGTAARLSAIDLGDENPIRVVSVSIDAPVHGPRRGGSSIPDAPLFYNFANPQAAVGNLQQAAADYFLLTRMLEEMSVEVDGIEAPIRFDSDNFYSFGHSQGATVAALFVPFEENVRAAVLSGVGGSLALSLLNKTSPEDVAAGVEFILTGAGTRATSVTDTHPLLSIIQMVSDRVDPLNFARLIFRLPPSEESDGTHVFMSYGFGDTYTPEPNQTAYAQAAGLQAPIPHVGDMEGYGETTYPVSGNRAANGIPVTALVVPVEPLDYDGHFVIFRDNDVADQAAEFIGTSVRDGVPTVSQR